MASFSVVTNIASSNAQANLQSTSMNLGKALNRLSSGFRINYSGDDAAGLAVANGYRNEQAILNQGVRNANDGLSNLQTKDAAPAGSYGIWSEASIGPHGRPFGTFTLKLHPVASGGGGC